MEGWGEERQEARRALTMMWVRDSTAKYMLKERMSTLIKPNTMSERVRGPCASAVEGNQRVLSSALGEGSHGHKGSRSLSGDDARVYGFGLEEEGASSRRMTCSMMRRSSSSIISVLIFSYVSSSMVIGSSLITSGSASPCCFPV